jgi:hypothetical protein
MCPNIDQFNSTQPSAFEQFHCDLPEIPNVKAALAAVIQLLKEKGLQKRPVCGRGKRRTCRDTRESACLNNLCLAGWNRFLS